MSPWAFSHGKGQRTKVPHIRNLPDSHLPLAGHRPFGQSTDGQGCSVLVLSTGFYNVNRRRRRCGNLQKLREHPGEWNHISRHGRHLYKRMTHFRLMKWFWLHEVHDQQIRFRQWFVSLPVHFSFLSRHPALWVRHDPAQKHLPGQWQRYPHERNLYLKQAKAKWTPYFSSTYKRPAKAVSTR